MMKNKWTVLLLLAVMLTLGGCAFGKEQTKVITNRVDGSTEEDSVEEIPVEESGAATEDKEAEEIPEEEPPEETAAGEESDVEVSSNNVTEVNFDGFEANVPEETFKSAVSYIGRQGDKIPSVNYSETKFTPSKRDTKAKAVNIADSIDSRLNLMSMKKIRMLREDNNGTTIDFTVYTNTVDTDVRQIEKIVSTEYCSDGRDVTNFYFTNGKLGYVYSYKDDIYGSTYRDSNIPGRKCYFSNNAMIECYINDDDALQRNSAYTAKDYKTYNEFIRTEFDALEKDLVNRAYTTYMAVKDIPGTALLSGYVADEYGGILSNVKITVTSKANEYSQEFTTNGDGYYEVRVPVNTADWYGMRFRYGDFHEVSIDDIHIPKGTIEYSLGITYMAADGENKHDTEYYLLDITQKPPKRLRDNEYQIILSYDSTKADLQPYTMSLNKGKSETALSTIITVDDDSQYKYFVTDQRGGRRDNTMTYEMSVSEAAVKVYNKDGLVASYQVPVNRAGVVWEVFEIDGTEIIPVSNYYYDVGKEIFFQ